MEFDDVRFGERSHDHFQAAVEVLCRALGGQADIIPMDPSSPAFVRDNRLKSEAGEPFDELA